MALVKRGAAVCIEEKELTADRLWDSIREIVDSSEKMKEMGSNARRTAILDASDRIYAVICDILAQNRK